MMNGKVLTFSHVAVAGYGAPATRCRYGASGRQADDADAGFQLSLALKFQQGDVIVQCLAVVVVMDVGGGHAQCLCSGTAVSNSNHQFFFSMSFISKKL